MASISSTLGHYISGGYVKRFSYYNYSYKIIPQTFRIYRSSPQQILD